MIKFHNLVDKKLFLREIEEYAVASTITEDYEPTDEMYGMFISKRKVKRGLKDHRAGQNTKAQWRGNRYDMLRGIRAFHKSTKGKEFHRKMSRYMLKGRNEQTYKSILAYEGLVSLSSTRTHLLLEANYYHSFLEQQSLEHLIESVLAELPAIEAKIVAHEELDEHEEGLLYALIENSDIIKAFSQKSGLPVVDIETMWNAIKESLIDQGHKESNSNFYSLLVGSLKNNLKID